MVLSGILFVLRSGIPWEMLPKEMGCGSGMTCWRRLKYWQGRGVWRRLHQVLLSELRGAEQLDFSRAVADSSSIRAVGAGKKVDRTQVGKLQLEIIRALALPDLRATLAGPGMDPVGNSVAEFAGIIKSGIAK